MFNSTDMIEDDTAYLCPECSSILDTPFSSSSTGFVTDYICDCGVELTVYSDGSAEYRDSKGIYHRDLERDSFLAPDVEEDDADYEESLDSKNDDSDLITGPSELCRFCGAVDSPSWHLVTVSEVGKVQSFRIEEKNYYCENCMNVINFYLGKTAE